MAHGARGIWYGACTPCTSDSRDGGLVPLSSDPWSEDTVPAIRRDPRASARLLAPAVDSADVPESDADPAPDWDLSQLVAALRDARSSREQWSRAEVERSLRPSRDALIEIVNGLR